MRRTRVQNQTRRHRIWMLFCFACVLGLYTTDYNPFIPYVPSVSKVEAAYVPLQLAPPVDYKVIAKEAASYYHFPVELILAIIEIESAGNTHAISRAGAMGLMQLMPDTASDLNVNNPFNPKENIFGGTKYLREQLNTFRDIRLALAAYNAGPRRVIEAKGIPNIDETKAYVTRVLLRYKQMTGDRALKRIKV